MRRSLVLVALSLALLAGGDPRVTTAVAVEALPDVVVIVTDDQRWDTLRVMPKTRNDLAAAGVTFTNAYTATPTCCPSRAGILTGRYPMGTDIWRNTPPHGGFDSFGDGSTVATWLHDAGYRTGLFGKYLNRYDKIAPTYIPPGWDRWYVHLSTAHYGYSVNDQGTVVQRGTTPSDYSTIDIASKAVSFIENTEGPLFAYVGIKAPHYPYTPPPGHEDAFGTLPRWRPPSYNEADVSDKPRWLRSVDRLDGEQRRAIDRDRLAQHRMLLGVDDAVRSIVRALRATGRLDDTLIVFTSDNGFSWGEHRLVGKLRPFEESIRIPMIVRYDPWVIRPGSTDPRLAMNIDIAATIARATGVPAHPMDGRSLLPLLDGTAEVWRTRFLTMIYTGWANPAMPSFCQLHTEDRAFTVYRSGEEEDYLLGEDPYQLENIAGTARGRESRDLLRRELQERCDPPPPDMRWP